MAKSSIDRQATIAAADIESYVEESATDFLFELECIRKLSTLNGWQIEHAGTYSDRVTGKSREFDIRVSLADKHFSEPITIRYAIECKRLLPSFPLVVFSTTRCKEEAYHQLIRSWPAASDAQGGYYWETVEVRERYLPNEYVGRSCVQVGKLERSGELTGTDNGIYGKWDQALASLNDIIYFATKDAWQNKGEEKHQNLGLAVPVVVIPDGTLWEARFQNGELAETPVACEHCSFFVGQKYSFPRRAYGAGETSQRPFTATHIEFVTLSKLTTLLQDYRASFPIPKGV